MTIATAHDLYRFFKQGKERVAVLKGLTLEVRENEFVCVMGPSGSGKSTLLHVLAGLDRADGGKTTLRGVALEEISESERTRLRRDTIGHVFQFFNLLPNLSVLENVGVPLAIQGRRAHAERAAIGEILERLGLAGREHAFPHELSGGEMQRVSIARALVGGQPLSCATNPRATSRNRRASKSCSSCASCAMRTAARSCSLPTIRAMRPSPIAFSFSSTESSRPISS